MLRNFGKTFLSLTIFLGLFLLAFNVQEARADASHNIRGWAYNSTYGYISMNCLDDNFAGRFTFTFPFPFFIAPCTVSLHGVNLDNSNNFSGDAWNTIIGYIEFGGTNIAPDYSFNINCESTCDSTNNCYACYNESTETVHGWARIKSTNEWIKLDDNSVPPTTRISNYNSATPGIFSGYASSTFGAISFNCTNDGSCGINPYEVRIGPIEIRQLTAPNWTAAEACDSDQAKRATLKWSRRSGIQTAYQIIINTSNTTSSPLIDTGKVSSVVNQKIFYPASFNYDTPYYWFLRLWDNDDQASPWRQFNVWGTKDILTDNSSGNIAHGGDSRTFTTYKHEFPEPYFAWSSTDVLIGTSTYFSSASSYYDNSNNRQSCEAGLACSYQWSISGDPLATNSNPTSASTTVVFKKATSTIVGLSITNDTFYTCSTSTQLNATYGLPIWKEVKAH